MDELGGPSTDRVQVRWSVMIAGTLQGVIAGLLLVSFEYFPQTHPAVFFVCLSLAGLAAGTTAAFGVRGPGLQNFWWVTFLGGVAYGLWGFPVGFFGYYIASPLLCSAAWSLILAAQFSWYSLAPVIVLGLITSAIGLGS